MYEELIKRLREIHPEEFGNHWDFAFACQQAMIDAAIQREIDRKVTRAAMKAKQASILNAMLCCLI